MIEKTQTAKRKDGDTDSLTTFTRNCNLQDSASQECPWRSESLLGSFLAAPTQSREVALKKPILAAKWIVCQQGSKSLPPLLSTLSWRTLSTTDIIWLHTKAIGSAAVVPRFVNTMGSVSWQKNMPYIVLLLLLIEIRMHMILYSWMTTLGFLYTVRFLQNHWGYF